MNRIFLLLFCFFLFACSSKQKADLIVHNGTVYTVDQRFSITEAFAIKDGKILAVGTSKDILEAYDASEKIDAGGKAVYPGFIDAHCHFYGYGQTLHSVNLVGTKSFDEVIGRVVQFSKTHKSEWITGRGWDQNDWEVKEFPTKEKLDSLFPNRPVFLQRIDGHAAIANSKALELAKITTETKIEGGEILRDHSTMVLDVVHPETGKYTSVPYPLSGILIDNAVALVDSVIPKPTREEMTTFLLDAQKNCFAVGLTTVDDAGLEKKVIDLIDELQKQDKLKMRVYAMLTDNKENLDHYLKAGPYKTDKLNVRSFKFYADGALGSRGACLHHPYHDQPGHHGFLLQPEGYFVKHAELLANSDFQMNTHCIGDSAVTMVINTYRKHLYNYCTTKANDRPDDKNTFKNRRWRLEHAQVTTAESLKRLECYNVQMNDLDKSEFNIIPSIQPTHATSDMYWAKDRLGNERVKTAYAYKDLLTASGMLALGTDFPVEHINPMYTFYAAIARKDLKGFPDGGFQTENALTREETLKGMTIWAAYSNFEEKEKGSIEKGKLADFVILEEDIMKIEPGKIPHVKVAATYIGGEKVYSK